MSNHQTKKSEPCVPANVTPGITMNELAPHRKPKNSVARDADVTGSMEVVPMRSIFPTIFLSGLLVLTTGAWSSEEAQENTAGPEKQEPQRAGEQAEKLAEAAEVFQEIMRTPDKGIPQELFEDADCVGIFPSVTKAALIVGGRHGDGFVTCRRQGGGWGPPAAYEISGGSWGFQAGVSQTDLVMLIMNRDGMEDLLDDKFTLGGNASVAAGPVGRTVSANTDIKMAAKILTYSRSRGVFGGLALEGAVVKADKDDNRELYGKAVSARELLLAGNITPPPAAHPLIRALEQYSAKHEARK
ncbi:MAG: lipid-binding SYLF domain-containing protein [Acidobacteria bacterium]|nr:lipid-binding SYLF domain-containing protein [Acidobacteriota bacterium]